MKKSEVKAMAERIAQKAKVINVAVAYKNEKAELAKRELRGMLSMLKILYIEYEFDFDYTSEYYTGFKISEYDIDIII